MSGSGPALLVGGRVGGIVGVAAVAVDSWEAAAAAVTAGGERVIYTFDIPETWAATRGSGFEVPAGADRVMGGQDDEPVWRFELAGVSFVILSGDRDQLAGPWRGLTARGLVDAWAQFRRLTGVSWSDSVGHTAEDLIRAGHNLRKGGRAPDRDAGAVPAPARDGGRGLEGPWTYWQRPLTGRERAAGYVHHFDGNAQYVAAWMVAEVGHGIPVHHAGPVFDPKAAGLWRIPAGKIPPMIGQELLPLPYLEGREWFTTATVARILECCEGMAAPMVAEAWLWPARSTYFRHAGEKLRDARLEAITAADAARAAVAAAAADEQLGAAVWRLVTAEAVLEAVKAIYWKQTGRLYLAGRDPRTGFARPDWGQVIEATARVNLHRRLEGLSRAPFAIATDGLLFATDEPDAAVFAESIALRRPLLGRNLGQFTHDGTAAAGDVFALVDAGAPVRDLFAAVKS